MEIKPFIYYNISFILLVVFECIYIFVNPQIDRNFEIRRVFDHRRIKNIKVNAIRQFSVILMTFIVYVIFSEVTIQLLYDEVEGTSEKLRPEIGSEVNPAGYFVLLFLLASIYMLNSGMTEKQRYKVMLIILFVSAPVTLLIGTIRGWMLNGYMGMAALIYGIIFVIVLSMFLHYWEKEDVG